MKICHGCQTELANATKTCSSCGATFGKPLEENEEAKRPGAAKDGEALLIFTDENDKTGAKAVTLKELNIKIDGVDEDAKVEVLVDLPKGTKNFLVTHALVDGKARRLNTNLSTLTVHGHARSIRGWMVDLNYTRGKHPDGTEEQIWLKVSFGHTGQALEPLVERRDVKGLLKKARELVGDSQWSARVKGNCAQARCLVPTVDGRLSCVFDGEGKTALEDATNDAAWQVVVNKLTHLKDMETSKFFLALPDDMQRDALLAKEGKRFDNATFEGHGHVTTANPPGTRVYQTKKGDKWEYIDASGVWRKAKDRDDAAEKALRNPHIRELVSRMEELEKNLHAYDVKYGNTTGGLPAGCLPQFFQDRDNRDGRGFNSEMFDVDAAWKFGGLRDVYAVSATPVSRGGRHVAGVRSTRRITHLRCSQVLYEALVTFNARLQEAGFPEDIVFGGPGEGGLLGFLCGNMDFTQDADLAAKLSDLLKIAADEEATTKVPALDRLQQLVKEQGVDVDIFEDATGYRPTEDQMNLVREWCELTTVLHKKATTRASLIYTLKLVKKAGDMESNVWTTNPFSRYFYALAVHNQIAYAVDTTIRLNFQAWFESKYGVGVTPLDLARGAVAAAPTTAAVPMDVDADEDDAPECMAAAMDEMAALPTVQARMDHFNRCMAAMSRRVFAPAPKQKRAREPVLDDDSPSPSPAPAPAPKKKKARKKKR